SKSRGRKIIFPNRQKHALVIIRDGVKVKFSSKHKGSKKKKESIPKKRIVTILPRKVAAGKLVVESRVKRGQYYTLAFVEKTTDEIHGVGRYDLSETREEDVKNKTSIL